MITEPMLRIECEKGCPATWVEGTLDDWWGETPPCPWCERNEWCNRYHDDRNSRTHAGHWPWRRWKITRSVASWAYQIGLIAGWSTFHGTYCKGCAQSFTWRLTAPRPYILGMSREGWRCLRWGHIPGEPIGFGMCGKCLPCPQCDSETSGHNPGCPEGNL